MHDLSENTEPDQTHAHQKRKNGAMEGYHLANQEIARLEGKQKPLDPVLPQLQVRHGAALDFRDSQMAMQDVLDASHCWNKELTDMYVYRVPVEELSHRTGPRSPICTAPANPA